LKYLLCSFQWEKEWYPIEAICCATTEERINFAAQNGLSIEFPLLFPRYPQVMHREWWIKQHSSR